MSPRSSHKQSGVALIAVMFVMVIAMVAIPSLMNRSSFVQSLSSKQVSNLRNMVKAAEVNHMFEVAVKTSPDSANLLTNFDRVFGGRSGLVEETCSSSDPCEKRLASQGACPFIRFRKEREIGGKKLVTIGCRYGKSPTDSSREIGCELFSADATLSHQSNMITLAMNNSNVQRGQKVTATGLNTPTVDATATLPDNRTTVTLSNTVSLPTPPGAPAPAPVQRRVSFEPSNFSDPSHMRLMTCVYDQGTTGANLAISIWSYIEGSNGFVKVKEDGF